MAIEIVDLPIKNGWIFHSELLVYQRVYGAMGKSDNKGDIFSDMANLCRGIHLLFFEDA
jgi:hypothetical protein